MTMLDTISYILDLTKKYGAEKADIFAIGNKSIVISTRKCKLDSLNEEHSTSIFIRTFIGNKSSSVTLNNFSNNYLETMCKLCCDMTNESLEDEFNDIAPKESLFSSPLGFLELYDESNSVKIEDLINISIACEDAALSQANITNSEGASVYSSNYNMLLATSNGFLNSYKTSMYGTSISVIAGLDNDMHTDYYSSNARFFNDLESANTIGIKAAKLASSKLGSRKVKTSKLPIIYNPRTARKILSTFASTINGNQIASGTSFLKNHLSKPVFNNKINIVDDATIPRGLGSRYFDGEGLPSNKKYMVKNGNLENIFLDIKSSNKLKLRPNASASRATSPFPSPSNLYIEKGQLSESEMIKDIKNGIYITELFGGGTNIINGTYSQGAYGFWIENGEITYPVNEFTIAGNLKDMFLNIEAANNLEMLYTINSPSLRIDNITISGV